MGIDVIGALYDFPEGYDAPPERLWGFHVNVSHSVLEEWSHLQQFVFQPDDMLRVWAGDDPEAPSETVRLRFNGENAARDALGNLWPEGATPAASPGQPKPK